MNRRDFLRGLAASVAAATLYCGNPNAETSAVDISGGIDCSRASGQTPCFIQVSASAISGTANILDTDGNVLSSHVLAPYEDFGYKWNFGDPASAEIFTNPVTGLSVNSNSDQRGPEATHGYRSAGTYTVTLMIYSISGQNVVTTQLTKSITVTAYNASGGHLYVDSVAGNDANDGLSSASPKQSISAINTKANVANSAIHLKRNSSWIGSDGIIVGREIVGMRIDAYGSGNDPKVNVNTGSNNAFLFNVHGVSVGTFGDVVISNIDLWRSGNMDTYICQIIDSAPAATVRDVYLDHIDMVSALSSGTGDKWCNLGLDVRDANMGVWGGSCIAQPGDTAAAIGIFGGARDWQFFVGFAINGAGLDAVKDHHIYPDFQTHGLFRWINFGDGPSRNYCLNCNWDSLSGSLEYAQYMLIADCNMTGTSLAHDGSNVDNDPTKVQFKNFVIQNNAIHDLRTRGALFFNIASGTWRDNYWWNVPSSTIDPGNGLADIMIPRIYRNYTYRTLDTNGSPAFWFSAVAFTLPSQITDNITYDTLAAAGCIGVQAASEQAANSLIDRNQYWIPNDTDSKGWFDGATAKTFAQWQAFGFDVNGSVANPNWPDPANGIFVSTPVNQPMIGNTSTGALSPDNTGGGFHSLCDPLFGVLGDELGHLHLYVGGQNRKVATSTRNDLFTVFVGSNGPGGCTLNGANVGDIVRGVIQITSSPSDKASSFESTISVKNQIRQVSTSDLSGQTFIVEVRRQS